MGVEGGTASSCNGRLCIAIEYSQRCVALMLCGVVCLCRNCSPHATRMFKCRFEGVLSNVFYLAGN